MSSFSVNGLSSGIDYNSLIENLVSVYRERYIDPIEAKKSDYEDKLTAYDTLSTKLETLETAVYTLSKSSTFDVRTAEVDDSTVLSASASSSAITGNYNISNISALAQAHKITHDTGWADEDTTAVASASGYFKWKVGSGGTEYSVAVDTSTTLDDLASAINSSGGGIKATIINDGSANPYRMVLTSETSGASNNIIITQDDTDLDTGVDTFSTTLQAAQDASFEVDGLSITKSTNTITDAISGVTITLKKTDTTNTHTITVGNDVDTIKSNIEAFIDDYNDVINHINDNNTYDTETNEGGPLFNEITVRSIQRRMRTIITSSVSGLSDDTKILAQIGVSTERDGTLTLNTTTLTDKLTADYSDVRALFINDLDTGIEGVGKQLYDEVHDITDFSSGAVTIRKDGIEESIDDYIDDIADEEDKLDRYEESLRVKFAALESMLSEFATQGDYINNITGLDS